MMPIITRPQMTFPIRSGPGPPGYDADRVLPSIEIVDLTGLSDEEEHRVNAGHNDNDEWEDVPAVIDLTNLPSDDEEDEDVVDLVEPSHGAPAPAPKQRKLQYLRSQTCELCNRVARYDRGVTKHHLYPQSIVKIAPTGTYTQQQKNATARLCWPCHSAIHRMIPNKTLAASFHSLKLLRAHDGVQSWIRKMQRATTAELDAPARRGRRLRLAKRAASKRKTRLLLAPSSVQRPLPSQRPEEDLSRFAEVRRSVRLAEHGTGAPGLISRVGASNTGRAWGVQKVGMTKKERKLAKKLEQAAKMTQVNQALDTLWERNGNSFPKYFPGKARKNRLLRDAIRDLCRNKDVHGDDVRAALRSRKEYREWYDWAFSSQIEAPPQLPAGPLSVNRIESPGVPEHDEGTTIMEGIEVQSEYGVSDTAVSDDPMNFAVLEENGDYISL